MLPRPTRRAVLAALPALAGAMRSTPLRAAGGPGVLGRSGRRPLAGVNLAGAEFGEVVPGVHGKDFIHPGPADFDGVAELGFSLVRLPFLWERLEPDLDGRLDPEEWRRIETGIEAAERRSLAIVLDLHNYARRRIGADGFTQPHVIGSREVPTPTFARLWAEIARRTAARPHVAYGLMNEPYDMPIDDWLGIANAAIAAIRAAPADNLVLVPGVAYSGADTWYEASNTQLAGLIDPASSLAIEVHQYLDADASGSNPKAFAGTIGSERIEAFQEWARARGLKAFLGEFGAGADDVSLAALADLLTEIEANPDVWIGWSAWAAGPWWPDDYGLKLSRDAGGSWPRQTRLLSDFALGKPGRSGLAPRAAIAVDLARKHVRGAASPSDVLTIERPSSAGGPRRSGRVELFARDEPRLTDLGLLIERPGRDLLAGRLGETEWRELALSPRPGPTGAADMRLMPLGGRLRPALAVEQPGWHSLGLWVRADPLHPARLTLSVGSAAATFDLGTGSIERAEITAAMSGAGDLRWLALSWYSAEAGVVTLDMACEPTDGGRSAGQAIEIAAPSFEAGPSPTHHVAPERAGDVVTLAGAAAHLVAADRATVLIETRRLAPAPVLRPLLATSATVLLGATGEGALATGLGDGWQGTRNEAAATMVKRRYAIAIDRRAGRAMLAATGAEAAEMNVREEEANGRWRIGGFGADALDGHVTRIALFAEALDAAALAAAVA
ncbi:MAG: glycoside hydrolase family 5 protein [Pseudomonadota bacterium]